MIWLISLATALSPPPPERSFETYAHCLHVHAQGLRGTATSPLAAARQAIANCASERAALIRDASTYRASELGEAGAREWAEQRVTLIDSGVPAEFLGRPVRIVPASECASELKDGDRCLE